MPLQFYWPGEADLDRVAETRCRCFSSATKDLDRFKEGLPADARARVGDYLLAERDGVPVGTTTSMSLHMWVRGGRIPIQGVAYVGTVRTARRGNGGRGGDGGGTKNGVATQLMHHTLDKAREREQVASALMPFRATFYEHFGYGLAERRTDWIVPLSIVPAGPADVFDYATPADRPAIAACRQRLVERGQCDVETSAAGWLLRDRQYQNGFEIIQRDGDQVCGWAYLASESRDGKPVLRVTEHAFDTTQGLLHLLHFLSCQRDQHATAWITLPSDVPLNRLLREPQLPHRPVSHAHVESRPFTRMQLRILNHKRFLEAMRLPERWTGAADIAVHETEGTISRFHLAIEHGHVSVKPSTQSPAIECADVLWASIASGDLPAATAARLGLLPAADPAAVNLLQAFSDGPVPYCDEYF
jgi:predicted acetyltransferase